MVKCTGRGLVVKRPGVLSKVQMLNLLLGVGVFSLLPSFGSVERAILGVEEDKWGIWLQDPKMSKIPQKQNKRKSRARKP